MPEYIDLYDADRNPLGITAERGAPLEKGQYGLAAGVWIFSSKNEIFLTRRSLEKRFMPGKWENTGGGVQAGETTRTAAVRELFEETGIVCEAEELVFIGTTTHENHFGDDFALRRDFPAEQVQLQPGETCDAKWVTEEEFDRMIASGELAPSTAANLAPFRERWNAVLHGK